MSKPRVLELALEELNNNPEQQQAVYASGHCIVLAGPGSGKTKTLTITMARLLSDEVKEPRGVACITYNNECSLELESRLVKLGITTNERVFIGTVHSFALTQIISPYARCIPGLLPTDYRIATKVECRTAVVLAYSKVFNDGGDPHQRWRMAEQKRRQDIDRNLPNWRGRNEELSHFIEAYEAELHHKGLIDFDDMPLIAYRMVKDHLWIRRALLSRFPILLVDEYQDLGHALHELVMLLCFEGGIRLFAVGDADQSIYGFTGANPELLQELTFRPDVSTVRLRFNYRSGSKIIRGSIGALGEERDYRGLDGSAEGEISFCSVQSNIGGQATYIAQTLLPHLLSKGIKSEQIAILYRAAWLGDKVAGALDFTATPYLRTDGNALITRSSKLARFIEACANWTTGGWIEASPTFQRLHREACSLVYGGSVTDTEKSLLSQQLMNFLHSGIGMNEFTHSWLHRFWIELIEPWKLVCRNVHQEWDLCLRLLERTDPKNDQDMPLNIFAGRIEDSGRITLSTLHSAKGREFDAVIMFGVNQNELPSQRDLQNEKSLREARRLFYVGVTRPRLYLSFVFQKDFYSPWILDLYNRIK
ncbi:ATP-dependent DNA helicase UvrD [Xenorhabdus vietnamensis]|uniref:DNA 3'-5' helicase n=1 Tax=Xenorhabdus vietnamensis TaxID=351656 RepID=A0A1Y2SI19_9GAMM|nr:ATP-dependent helicase [Xenorhabdus vietnamensis]OTA18056.1 ATP-dependent DNA helicase UvrD [Xenorhabdus vietnamensis]